MQPRLFRLCVAAAAAAGFLTLAPRASADTLNLTFDSGANGNGLNGGGAFHWTQTAPLNTNFGTALTTYCIDLKDTLSQTAVNKFNTTTDLTQAPAVGNNPVKVAAIDALFDHFYSTSLTSTTLEAAFQQALWDLLYGSTSSLVAARPTTATVTADANAMLSNAAWNGSEHDLANAHLVALVSATGGAPGSWGGRTQDQILVEPNPPVAGVPAPPGLMLAGIGAVALLGRARLRRRAPAAA
jgi:hypothetical protein